MADVVVYQMGKVASEAICDALTREGINAAQSHFLGEKNLVGVLRNLIRPDFEDFFIHHATGQLVQNIENTRKVLWYKKFKEKEGEKLKVITLARDPINWYRANFVQNFNGYYGGIKQWVDANHPGQCDHDDLICYLRTFYAAVFDRLAVIKSQPGSAQYPAEVAALSTRRRTLSTRPGARLGQWRGLSVSDVIRRSLGSAARPVSRITGSSPATTGGRAFCGRAQERASQRPVEETDIGSPDIVTRHLNILNRPLTWFDHFFAPMFGLDIFKQDFDVDRGFGHFSNDFCDVLLIRYENLGSIHGVIGDFVGVDGFTLQKVNISDSKPHASEVYQAFECLNDRTAAVDKVYSSKYCAYFGYTPDLRFRNFDQ